MMLRSALEAKVVRDGIFPQLASKTDLERLGDRMEALLWKHSVAIILAVVAVGGFPARFLR